MRRAVLEEAPLYGDFHRFLPVLAERLGFAVREVSVGQHPRATAPLVRAPGAYLWRALDIPSIFFLSPFTRAALSGYSAEWEASSAPLGPEYYSWWLFSTSS